MDASASTLRLGQDGALSAPPFVNPEGRQDSYSVTALSTSMLTPGPMVELSDTFFM